MCRIRQIDYLFIKKLLRSLNSYLKMNYFGHSQKRGYNNENFFLVRWQKS